MSILLNKKTKVMIQGITGTQASFHLQRALKYGTNIVAGVVPNKKEDTHLGIPVFNTVLEAKKKTKATASVVFVPSKFAKDAILEAIRAKLELVVVITSQIPVHDMLEIRHELSNSKTILIGPNTPGVITPDEAYVGVFPDNIHKSGNIGIVSRSSTLTYEVVLEINSLGLGESTVVVLGDDYLIGTNFNEIVDKFNDDKDTKAVVMICGLGDSHEIESAKILKDKKFNKPIIALLIEDPNSSYKDNNLASNIVCNGIISYEDKKRFLEDAGIMVVSCIKDMKETLSKL